MNYKVKYIAIPPARNKSGKMTNRGRQDDIYYEMKEFQPIFSVNIDKELFTVNFKSTLGKLILHNTLMLDTDWIPEEAFELNKNAYFIYKRFILNSAAAKYKKEMIELWFNDVKSFLDLKSKNNTYIHKEVINRSLEEMQKLGLIIGYKWNKHYKQRQYRVTITDSGKELEKRHGKSDKLLKVPM
jgi:DNA-binding HxlR family transcriptional regulator